MISQFYDVTKPDDFSDAFKILIDTGLIHEDLGVFTFTALGEVITPKLVASCPRNLKKYNNSQNEEIKEFEPDS